MRNVFNFIMANASAVFIVFQARRLLMGQQNGEDVVAGSQWSFQYGSARHKGRTPGITSTLYLFLINPKGT